MEKVIRDGIMSGEFRAVDDVPLTACLLSGIMRTAADRMTRGQLQPRRPDQPRAGPDRGSPDAERILPCWA